VETEVSGGAVGKEAAQGLLHRVESQFAPGNVGLGEQPRSIVSAPGLKAALASSAR